MSEMIKDEALRGEQRKNALMDVIKSLRAGRTVDEVKGEFSALLQEVDGGEIAELEQALIADGLPEDEIKRLCDVHVAVFEGALELQAPPEASPGHPIDIMRAENAKAESAMQALELAIIDGDWDQARARLATLRLYERHYVRKENILFPYLERYGFTGPSSVMWAIHDDIRTGWKSLDALLAEGPKSGADAHRVRIESSSSGLIRTMRDVIYKEEHILVPAALERLTERDWQEVRAQGPEVGYFQVAPDGEWQDKTAQPEGHGEAVRVAAPDPADSGLLPLDTGLLTGTELNLLLTHLPIDVTYVGVDDTVRYFSAGRERIFPRSPAIIGRKVQKCHPPASMHRVQQILDDFRSGTRDEAEFWIQMAGKFIHIRYFALRDGQGAYQGALEVSQDVTGIRQLSGERRLLGGPDGG